MRRYAAFRIMVLACLLAVAGILVSTAWAEGGSGAAADAAKEPGRVNPFSIIFQNGIDFVFVVIITCSIIGLTLIIQGFIRARAAVMIPQEVTNHIREMISQRQFKELIDFTEADGSFVSRSLNPALKRAPSFAAMKEAMETAIGEQTAEQFRRIEYLNIIGNLGPLLGLLGTVLGMITAFEQMRRSGGNADPKVLSGGIAQALTHTMLGLMLALPCLVAFGVLRTMIDRLTVRGALIAEELLLMIKPAEAKPAAAAAARPAGVPGVPQPAVPQPAAVQPAVMPPPPPIRKAPVAAPPVPNPQAS